MTKQAVQKMNVSQSIRVRKKYSQFVMRQYLLTENLEKCVDLMCWEHCLLGKMLVTYVEGFQFQNPA